MKTVETMKVVSHKEIALNIYELILKGELVSQIERPGQFVHVKIGDGTSLLDGPLLRRPISIANINLPNSEMSLIYRANGKGTTMLSRKDIGDEINVLGPLGNGFPIDNIEVGKVALLVGGGIGVPPLYELSKQLVKKGIQVIHVLGFQTKDDVFLYEAFQKLGETFVATEDGSFGTKGLVTDVIKEKVQVFDRIYSCGPTPMLKALEDTFHDKEVYISLEERMSCGIGACFACVKKTSDGQGYRKVCSDGPVFLAGEVIL
ncbi:dihydroorotate dehydrogenase electron transfer subunit [Bacillus andreraoultii]|uniref:dihydroorotate dehydrogenase electron transfer subunit n=1 Tax=Bacillus andreraoultii TaxID=1499685 RepID=UPI00053A2874|nr:dihydroorotate dehydrogenase electron transfer subunit [Bacillus andreraoultii]